jgi:hypothetical protein
MFTCLSEVLSQCNNVNFKYFMIRHEQFCYIQLVLEEIRSPDRPARSESLYRLRYPGPYTYIHSYIHTVQNLTARNTKEFGNGRATFCGYGVEWRVLCYAIILESTRLLSLPSFLETTLMCEY